MILGTATVNVFEPLWAFNYNKNIHPLLHGHSGFNCSQILYE